MMILQPGSWDSISFPWITGASGKPSHALEQTKFRDPGNTCEKKALAVETFLNMFRKHLDSAIHIMD